MGYDEDLVNLTSKPGPSGYPNGAFRLEVKADNKTITKIEIADASGKVHWSSEGKPPIMFLGVATYPKTDVLSNTKGGPLNLPVSSRISIYLYAAENNLIGNPNSVLTVRVTFTDRTSVSTTIIK